MVSFKSAAVQSTAAVTQPLPTHDFLKLYFPILNNKIHPSLDRQQHPEGFRDIEIGENDLKLNT